MRKASKIIFLVAAIVSIVCAVCYLIAGLLLVIIPNTQAWTDVANEVIKQNPQIKASDIDALKVVFIVYGVCFLIEVPLAGVNSFFSFKARKEEKPSKALNVLNIVFGVLSGVIINIVAAIFAFVANGIEERRAQVEKK